MTDLLTLIIYSACLIGLLICSQVLYDTWLRGRAYRRRVAARRARNWPRVRIVADVEPFQREVLRSWAAVPPTDDFFLDHADIRRRGLERGGPV